MFLNFSQKITPKMIAEALKISSSDPIFKYKKESFGHRIGFHEAIIFTRYGKIVVSDYSSDCFSSELGMCHGFSYVKTLKTGEKYYKKIILTNGRTPTAYYSIEKCFEMKNGVIRGSGLQSCKEEGIKIIGIPKQERYCFLEYKGNQIRVLKTFRKLPNYYINWKNIIYNANKKLEPSSALMKAFAVLLPKTTKEIK